MRNRTVRSLVVRFPVLFTAAFLVLGIFSARARGAAADPCGRPGAFVAVDTHSRRLSLCADGAAAETFRVALGAGGIGKRRTGDNRTPLGAYPLGSPRHSQLFGTFIPVGYPTATQARAGFSGGAVGIHGPARAFVFAGSFNTATDWTAGCIAVGSDPEIGRIAAWVRTHPRVEVRID
jgi:hypothetical protein